MNFKKISAVAASMALAASMLALSASAADWSVTGYADDDPNTVKIVSTQEDGVTFTQQDGQSNCKARLCLVDMLADPADAAKVTSGSWKITYTGLSVFSGTEIGWLGGGCYCGSTNSTGFGLSPVDYNEDGTAIWDDTQTVEDSFKYLLPSQKPTEAEGFEFVFMDWSGQDLASNGITLTISDFHLYDEDGNEIAQKAYGAGAVTEEAAPAEEAATEEVAATEEAAPASDATEATTSTATGNVAAAALAAVAAVAGVAAVATRKRK